MPLLKTCSVRIDWNNVFCTLYECLKICLLYVMDFFVIFYTLWISSPKGRSRHKNWCMARFLSFLIRYFSNYYTLHRSDLAARAAPLDPRLSSLYVSYMGFCTPTPTFFVRYGYLKAVIFFLILTNIFCHVFVRYGCLKNVFCTRFQ